MQPATLLLLLTTVVVGLTSAAIVPLSASDRAYILNLHNSYRARQPARYMPTMTWDSALAATAQRWTNSCRYGHQYSNAFGENIGAGYGPGYDTNQGLINNIFNLWVAESKYVTDSNFSCCGPSSLKCCHFLQVIWANSNKIGCGLSKCGFGGYLACYYQPKGNIMMNGKMSPYTPR